jgi:4-hydroxythreonine-4-phosphate dehydrogenase
MSKVIKCSIQPVVAITMGDPSGIGPEILVKSLALKTLNRYGCRLMVIGIPSVFEEILKILNLKLTVKPVSTPEETGCDLDLIYVLPIKESFDRKKNPWGEVTYDCGRTSLATVELAAKLMSENSIAACATTPVSKEAFYLAGVRGAGHAEIFAKAAGVDTIATMLCHNDFRVVHLTTHLSLREACLAVKKKRIIDVVKLTFEGLQHLGIKNPRIAVAALNPHGGDGGLFGREEIDEIEPAVEELRGLGFGVTGPIPADIVFSQARGGMWDVVVAMYHDQGHIPIKVASFEFDNEAQKWISTGGVTVTLGLPYVRTSVDHGTAFDIGGKGIAEPGAMISAIELAARYN